jgi:hypothetical protein
MADDANEAAGDPQDVRAEHRVEIQAPAETIWALVSDLEGWNRWNPIYRDASSALGLGETVTATVTIPGANPNTFTAEISAWEPNKKFGWYSSALDGQMQMTRYMEIEKVGDRRCVFVNGELFGGQLGPSIMGGMAAGIQDGFRLMNEALKAAAEAR